MLDETNLKVIGTPVVVSYDLMAIARSAKSVVIDKKAAYVASTDETLYREIQPTLTKFGLGIKKVMLGKLWVGCVINEKRSRRRKDGSTDSV